MRRPDLAEGNGSPRRAPLLTAGAPAARFSRKGLDAGCPVAESGPGRPACWPRLLVLTQTDRSESPPWNLAADGPTEGPHLEMGPGLLRERILKRTFYSCVGIKVSMFISYVETFSST